MTANNRIVGDDYPHHITSEWMTGYRARRIEEMLGERERHSLAGLRADAARLLLVPRRRDGAPALAPASARPARDARDRAAQELGRQPRRPTRSPARSTTRSRVVFAQRRRAAPRSATSELRRALAEQVRRRAVRGRVLAVALPGAAARAVGRGRPGLVRLAERPEGRPWDEVALEALEQALDGLEERFGRDSGPAGAGGACTASSSPTRSARRTRSSGGSSTAACEAGGASETVTQNGYLRDRALQGRVGARLPDARRPRRPARARAGSSPPGQSGHPGSRHYDDMIEGWRDGRTNPVYLDEHEVARRRAARSSCASTPTS